MTLVDFEMRLLPLITSAFSEADLTIDLYADSDFFDFAKRTNGNFTDRVLQAIQGYSTRAQAPGVLRLAKLCHAARPGRPELGQFVVELEAFIATMAAQPAPPPAPAPGPDLTQKVLAEVTLLTQNAVEKGQDMHTLADMVRPAISQPGVDSEVLAEAFHLSTSSHQRLAAVLALEYGLIPRYLQWLAERIIVESPAAAMYAVQALTVFALKTPRTGDNLTSTWKVLKQARHRLDNLDRELQQEDPPLQDPRRSVDITMRKRQVATALSVLERRMRQMGTPKHLKPDEFDQLAMALVTCLTVEEFEQLLKQGFDMSLRRMVTSTDTLEQMVCRVLQTAWESEWEGELAFSVSQTHGGGRPACQLPFAARFATPIV